MSDTDNENNENKDKQTKDKQIKDKDKQNKDSILKKYPAEIFCPICMEISISAVIHSKCGHSICGPCKDDLLKSKSVNRCVICNQGGSDYVPNYFLRNFMAADVILSQECTNRLDGNGIKKIDKLDQLKKQYPHIKMDIDGKEKFSNEVIYEILKVAVSSDYQTTEELDPDMITQTLGKIVHRHIHFIRLGNNSDYAYSFFASTIRIITDKNTYLFFTKD